MPTQVIATLNDDGSLSYGGDTFSKAAAPTPAPGVTFVADGSDRSKVYGLKRKNGAVVAQRYRIGADDEGRIYFSERSNGEAFVAALNVALDAGTQPGATLADMVAAMANEITPATEEVAEDATA